VNPSAPSYGSTTRRNWARYHFWVSPPSHTLRFGDALRSGPSRIRTSPPGTRISSPLAHFRRDVSAISNNHFNSSRVELSIRTFTRSNIACVFAEFGNANRISTFCVRRVKFVMRAARPKKANCAKVALKWRLRRNTADGLDFVALNFTVDFDK
jgi:hypothetical protein